MRFRLERDRPRAWLLRVFTRQGEVAYAVFGLRGIRADIRAVIAKAEGRS